MNDITNIQHSRVRQRPAVQVQQRQEPFLCTSNMRFVRNAAPQAAKEGRAGKRM